MAQTNDISGKRRVNGRIIRFRATYSDVTDTWHCVVMVPGYPAERRDTTDMWAELSDMLVLASKYQFAS